MVGKWQLRFLFLAGTISSFSKDPSTKVGAIIARPDNTVASMGFNGFPRGIKDNPAILRDREEKYLRIVHAEANAIVTAHEPLHGYNFFCTHPPCGQCCGLIIQSGISRVYWVNPIDHYSERWQKNTQVTSMLLEEAGIPYIRVEIEKVMREARDLNPIEDGNG